ncbi:MAG: anti-sigma factor family protein [Leptospirales bacterium]
MDHSKIHSLMSCREISALASASLDRSLSLQERFILRAHLLFCRACHAYSRQIRLIEKIIRTRLKNLETLSESPDNGLAEAARARILAKLRATSQKKESDPSHDN